MALTENIFKKCISLFCIITALILLAPKAFAANTTVSYDVDAAVEWASNESEHKAVKDSGRCAWYVCQCLKHGGLGDVAAECASKKSYTPGVMTEYIESKGYGTVTKVDDDSLANLKAGDIVTIFCGASKHGSGYYGLHTFFVTGVNQDKKTLTYSQNNEYRHNKEISFSSLKKYSIKCISCNSSKNSYVRIISMVDGTQDCQHDWMENGYCAYSDCGMDYVVTDEFENSRTSMSGVCISAKSNSYFEPSVRPYEQAASLELKACYTTLEPVALVTNSLGEKWYEINIEGKTGYIWVGDVVGSSQIQKSTPTPQPVSTPTPTPTSQFSSIPTLQPSSTPTPQPSAIATPQLSSTVTIPTQKPSQSNIKQTFTFNFDAENGYEYRVKVGDSLNSVTLCYGDSFTLPQVYYSSFKTISSDHSGWYVKRENDNSWYVAGKGWCTDAEVRNDPINYAEIFDLGLVYKIDSLWTSGCEADNYVYTFYPWGSEAGQDGGQHLKEWNEAWGVDDSTTNSTANSYSGYDIATAVEWAANESEHKAVKNSGGGVWYVCQCLKYGGLDDVAEACATQKSYTPGVMTEYIESKGYGTVTKVDDDSLANLKAGDIVVAFCGASKHGSGYYGLQAFFVTSVDQSKKVLTYSQNNTYRHNQEMTFSELKNYAVKCDSCNSSKNSYARIISMVSSKQDCQHGWMEGGYCVYLDCGMDYVDSDEFKSSRVLLSGVCISAKSNSYFVPSVRPYDQAAFLELKACYTSLEPVALVTNSYGEKWYEVNVEWQTGYIWTGEVVGSNVT